MKKDSIIWFLYNSMCMQNGLTNIMVCNEITCVDFSNFWSLLCNLKWSLLNHFNIILKFYKILLTPKIGGNGKISQVILWN
jgi:hypothetical protein